MSVEPARSEPARSERVGRERLARLLVETRTMSEDWAPTFAAVDRAAVPFAIGVRVRDCVQAVADKRDGARPVWLYGLTDASWAVVMFRDGESRARVWQSGPRRLWDEVEAAFAWWVDHGRPGHARFGLTVSPDGQRAWLDEPDQSWPV